MKYFLLLIVLLPLQLFASDFSQDGTVFEADIEQDQINTSSQLMINDETEDYSNMTTYTCYARSQRRSYTGYGSTEESALDQALNACLRSNKQCFADYCTGGGHRRP